MGLAGLGLSDATLQALAASLQGVVTAGAVSDLPYPLPSDPGGKVARLSLLNLCFSCRVAGDSDLPPMVGSMISHLPTVVVTWDSGVQRWGP